MDLASFRAGKDFYSYFCIYLFCLCRGMNQPLLPKAITAWAQAHFYADVTFFAIPAKIKPSSQDNLSQM